MTQFPRIDRPREFIVEREIIRLAREAGEAPPWSDDPVLAGSRFCQVERERDRTTTWIREHWREPHAANPDLWFLMLIARLINKPRVLAALTPPLPSWDKDRFVAEMREAKAQGLFAGKDPYTLAAPPAGLATRYESKFEFHADCIFDPAWNARERIRPRPGDSCETFSRRLRELNYVGSFYAGQIIADTKFVGPLSQAPDWWTFATMGAPNGSQRGLNLTCERDPAAPWAEREWLATFECFVAEMVPWLAEIGMRLSAQDLQSVLCETSRLWKERKAYDEALAAGKPWRPARPFKPHGESDAERNQSARDDVPIGDRALPRPAGTIGRRGSVLLRAAEPGRDKETPDDALGRAGAPAADRGSIPADRGGGDVLAAGDVRGDGGGGGSGGAAHPALSAPAEPLAPAPHALPELAHARNTRVPHILHFDFETRSATDLTAVGVHRYAADASTEVLCCAYAVDDEPTQLWVRGDPVPSEFVEAASNPNWLVIAHNAAFERAITRHILKPRFGWPEIPIERWRCSMAMARAAALPGSLEKAAAALGLPVEKDKAGQKVMRQIAKSLPDGGGDDN
jgi:hypothetical protein